MSDAVEPINFNNCVFEFVDETRLPLVNRFYSSCNYRVKCGRAERVYALRWQGEYIAAARLIPQPSGQFLLRNLCVSTQYRRQGIASYFMRQLLAALKPAECYCFALVHLREFYLSLGFLLLEVTQVPPEIAAMYLRHRERQRTWPLMGTMDFGNLAHKQN